MIDLLDVADIAVQYPYQIEVARPGTPRVPCNGGIGVAFQPQIGERRR
jgi:hypothetical protein